MRRGTWHAVIITASALFPTVTHAAIEDGTVHLSIINYLLLALTLMVSLVMFFIFQRRFRNTDRELKDLTGELSTTRKRLNESNKELESTQKDLKATTNRYQGILFNAGIGMFQLDLQGKCTYVNTAMQQITGMYQKRAQQEGLAAGVHPDDRPRFKKAWKALIDGDAKFNEGVRFQFKRGREIRDVHVTCQIDKVLNARDEAESYIGWITDVTPYYKRQRQEQVKAARYSHFLNETLEGYFRLVPEEPIPLASSASAMADEIMKQMKLLDCNAAFATMYGSKPEGLQGKGISELSGGCGPFKNKQDLIYFIEDGYKSVHAESVKQDPRGNRLTLLNDVIGIIEDKKLVGIWGAQQNISKQKRETAELASRANFLERILSALPADVHVKDTRCRYLFASKKMADRTGIAQDQWLGKTILEVMPGTARDHDQHAIEAMKSGKLIRIERPYEARGQSGWMETIQIPLVSGEGLVEGVVGLSLDISDRKDREADASAKYEQLEKVLKQTRSDLNNTRGEYNKTAASLSEALQKLKTAETERNSREHQFKQQLDERKRAEESLRRSEEGLLTRQRQLEEQLSGRLAELEAETDKRKKWEELLAIKEDELRKVEELSEDLGRQLAETEEFLKNTQEQLIQITAEHTRDMEKEIAAREAESARLQEIQHQLDQGEEGWLKKIEDINVRYQSELDDEEKARTTAEKRLSQTEQLLQKTQTDIKQMTERHSRELEEEVAERKGTAEKLIQSMEELDELKQKFNERLEEETKSIKHELAQKQIREKTLRQNEKDLEERIKELEGTLQMKSKEFTEQIQAREGAEVQKKQIEQRLEQMTQRQKELVARETQKLQLHIAEIRLEEVKLRKEAGDLQREKESLEELLETRNGELDKAVQKQEGTEALLSETKSQLKKLSDNQDQLIAAETESLRTELEAVKHNGEELQNQLQKIESERHALEQSLGEQKAQMDKAGKEYAQVKKALSDTEKKLKELTDSQSKAMDAQAKAMHKQLEQEQKSSAKLEQQIDALNKEKQAVEKNLEIRTQDLAKAAREYRKVVDAYKTSQSKLKQLADNQEAALAQQTQALNDELTQLRKDETELRHQCEKLNASIDDQKKDIEELHGKLKKETDERIKAEKSLQDLQTAVESDKENAEALVEEQTKALQTRISSLEQSEEQFKQQLEKTRQTVAERDEQLDAVKTERQQAEERVKEVESRLAGIRKEHQAELKKSMAEVKEISRLNGELVDELNGALENALNPVVKTSILMEKSENLSEEQKRDLAKVGLNCRGLIDMMNYRCELTHLADGSEELTAGQCDLHGLMTDIDHQFSHRAETKKLFFAVSFAQYQAAHNVPKIVSTDEVKLRKILSILLGYAMEKTTKGRLGLHATRKSNSEDSVLIDFELAYTGNQETDPLLSAIYGPNNDSSDTVDVKYGLTLARRYIGLLDGTFTLEYRSGGVTALNLQFPFRKSASGADEASDGEKKAGAA
jgi:PAS domain S-box-containing protein